MAQNNTDTAVQDPQTDRQLGEPRNQPSENNQSENQHAPLPASDNDLRRRRFNLRNPRFRMFLILGLIVLVVAGFFLWRYFGSYEDTDDAQIDGHLNSISARVSGHGHRHIA